MTYRNKSRPTARRMTRAHFETIAEALRAAKPADRPGRATDKFTAGYDAAVREGQWLKCVGALAAACAASNERFRREDFLRACGCEPTEEGEE